MSRPLAILAILFVLAVAFGVWLVARPGDDAPAENHTTSETKTKEKGDPAGVASAVAEAASGVADKGGRAEIDPKATLGASETVKTSTVVRGRVVSSESNAPIADARVYLDPHSSAFRFVIMDTEEEKKGPSALTGPDGRFVVRDIAPGKAWDLRIEAPARRRTKAGLQRLTKGEEREMGDVVMEQGATVDGRVTDGAGAPIVGAFVMARKAPQGNSGVVFFAAGEMGLDFEGLTDAAGRYRIDGLPASEPFTVSGSAEARVSATSEPFTPRLGTPTVAPDLVLREGKEITGKVVKRDGTAVAGAVVLPFPFGRAGTLDPFLERRNRKEILTDSEGRFRIRGLDDRNVEIQVNAEGIGAARKRGVAPGTRDLVIELEPRGSIHGKLVAAPGVDNARFAEAFAEFSVNVERIPDGSMRGVAFSDSEGEGRSLENGAFEVTGLGKGKYRVHVAGEGFTAAVSDVVEITPGRKVDNVEIAVSPGRVLEVKVTRAGTDEPIAGARVRVKEVREDNGELDMAMMGLDDGDDEDGDLVSRSGAPRTAVRATRAVEMRAGRSVSGAASSSGGHSRNFGGPFGRGGDGKPDPYNRTHETDEKGQVRFAGLPDGNFEVRARKLDMAPSSTSTVTLDATATLTTPKAEAIEMTDGGSLEGIVTRGGESPASSVTVELVGPEPSNKRLTALTDGKGFYKFEHLVPGAYHASIERTQSGSFVMQAEPNATPTGAPVAVVEAKVAKLDLTAPAILTVVGIVTQAGAPVAGVRVNASAAGDQEFPGMVEFGGEFGSSKSATTGADGKYRLEGLEAGKYRFRAQKPGTAKPATKRVELLTDMQRVDLTLPRGVIEGRVVKAENSEPIVNASVALLEGSGGEVQGEMLMMTVGVDSSGGSDVMTFDGRVTVKTDAQGRYKLEDVPAGKYRLRATAPGLRETKSANFELAEDARLTDMDVKMEKAAILLGRVTGPGGAARPSVMIHLVKVGETGPSAGPPKLKVTDGEGRYRFDSLDPGEYKVSAQSMGEGGVMRLELDALKGASVMLVGGAETTKDFQVDK